MRYDLSTNAWSGTHELNPAPYKAEKGSTFFLINEEKALLCGGHHYEVTHRTDTAIYDVNNDQWRVLVRSYRGGRFKVNTINFFMF